MSKRIIFSITLLVLMFYLPIWMFLFFVLLGMFLFNFFWEGILLFLFSQMLFGGVDKEKAVVILGIVLVPVIALCVIEFLKNKLKFYDK